jgi:hypothetical protein
MPKVVNKWIYTKWPWTKVSFSYLNAPLQYAIGFSDRAMLKWCKKACDNFVAKGFKL